MGTSTSCAMHRAGARRALLPPARCARKGAAPHSAGEEQDASMVPGTGSESPPSHAMLSERRNLSLVATCCYRARLATISSEGILAGPATS